MTDVQTETRPPEGLLTNGLHSRIICEDVEKVNFLSRKLRALLPFSHRSFEKKQQNHECKIGENVNMTPVTVNNLANSG